MSTYKINFQMQDKYNFVLSLFICAIIPSLVVGAAVMEFFIFLSCILFFFLNFKKIGLNYYKKIFFIIFSLFCFFLILSSLLSDNLLNSLRNTIFYFRFGILALIICYLLDNYKKFKLLFFNSIFITLIAVIVYSFIQIFFLKNYVSDNRISGLFGDELVQGSFLLRITPIFFIFFLYNKAIFYNKYFIFIFYLLLSSSLLLIIFSGERSAIFLSGICIFLSFLFFKLNFIKIFLSSLLILIISVSAFYIYPKSKVRVIDKTISQLFYVQDVRGKNIKKNINFFSEGHQDHMETGIMIFKKNYILGIGVRNFRIECKNDEYKIVGKYYCSTHPHNTYIQLLAETGLIGFSFIMLFLLFVFKEIHMFFKNSKNQKKKLNITLASCFVIILINLFPFVPTGSFFNNWLSTVYFIPVGLLLHEIDHDMKAE
jgi:O-antigen ligase